MVRLVGLIVMTAFVCSSHITAQEKQKPEVKKPESPKYSAPVLTITGADKPINIGELVVLDATLDNPPKDLATVSYSWTVLPQKNIVTWPDGAKIIFGTGTRPQSVTVILTASFLFTTKDQDKITDVALRTATTIATVKIVQDGTDPEPGPGPGPGPGPVVPTSAFAKNAQEWVASVKTTNKYGAKDVKADAAALAQSFERIAAAIAAGTIKGPQNILKESKDSNDSAIQARDNWLPWFNKLSEALQSANKSGSLKSDDDYAKTWREIAKGLTAASK